jgi:phosphatidyl-myo-inositol alpha-mannosyltransferase
MLRIAQVIPYDIRRPGGVGRHIYDLSAALIKLGHEVTIITPRLVGAAARDLAESGVGTASIEYIGKGWLVSANGTQFEISLASGRERARLDQLLQPGRFDVIHFHTLISPFLPLQVFKRSHCARVATFHNVPPSGTSGSLQRVAQEFVVKRLVAHLDDVIFASHVQNDLYSFAHHSFSVIPPGVDLQRFSRGAQPRAKNAENGLDILFVGRLEPRKGAHVLLQAYNQLRARYVSARLRIVGDGPERPALERFVRENFVPDVDFLGTASDSDLPSLYAAADIFCAPSPYGEGFGIVLTEAMAAGRPVVAAKNEGYRLVLQGEAAAFLVTPGDVEDTRQKLEKMILDPALRCRLGAWGRREAQKYDIEVLVPQFVAIYQRAIGTHSRTAG